MSRCVDLTGKRYGKLTVIGRCGNYVPPSGHKHALWECKCDCGNISHATTGRLNSGNTKSCGCWANLKTAELNKTHGESKTRLYRIWKSMRMRCLNKNNPQYKDYGGRGISICDEWLSDYMSFRNWALSNGYADELTIDRIDVNGSYSPQNCRWITLQKQQDNRRNTIHITRNGTTKTASEWAELTGISYNTIRMRYYRGFAPEHILCENKVPWGTYRV